MCLIRRIGGRGLNNGQFNHPSQITTDPNGDLFITDCRNNRICIHDADLNHICNITHESMSLPAGIKISRDCLYVLCQRNSPCMHVLTLEGHILRSFINRKQGMYDLCPFFFCFDSVNNLVIRDYACHLIGVFSPEGNLLHMIGREGHQPGMFYHPKGVAVTPNGRLVCVSETTS